VSPGHYYRKLIFVFLQYPSISSFYIEKMHSEDFVLKCLVFCKKTRRGNWEVLLREISFSCQLSSRWITLSCFTEQKWNLTYLWLREYCACFKIASGRAYYLRFVATVIVTTSSIIQTKHQFH
jgi:hypothetical protein